MKKRNQDEVIAELAAAVKELQAAQQESAAALALSQNPALQNINLDALLQGQGQANSKTKGNPLTWQQRLKRTLLTFLAGAAFALGVYAYFAYTGTVSHNKEVIVTGVHDLATLTTAEAYVMTTIEGQDNKLFGQEIKMDLPGTKRVYFFVIPGKLQAGVDLSQVTQDDIQIDTAAQKVEILIPHATFLEEIIQVDQVQVFTDAGLFRSVMTAEESLAHLSDAKVMDKLRREANAQDILKRAEENAVRVLEGFYENLGYDVTVTFK